MVTIPLSSNIVNLLYIVSFDLIMPVALTWSIAILLSSVNLKIIHDDRKVLWLRQAPVPHLFNRGVSTRLIGLAVALASGLVVVLSIAGSFSINGVSTPRSKQVPYIVDRVTSEDALDLWHHVYKNETGSYTSSSFLAMDSGSTCVFFAANGYILYSSFVNTETPESEWTSDLVKSSVKCRTTLFGLEPKIVFKFNNTGQPYSRFPSCNVTVPDQSEGSVVQVNPALQGECPFRILEFFCANAVKFSCAGWIESNTEILLFAKEFPKTPGSSSNTLFYSGLNYVEKAIFPEKPPTESLHSIAYLLGANVTYLPLKALLVSMLTVKGRGTIKELETVEETVVNETLFIATVTPALMITFGVVLGACTSRYLFRTKPGRSDYNSFLSARDMLLCALNEAKGEKNSRMGSSESCFVTTLDGEPYLVHGEDERDAQDGV